MGEVWVFLTIGVVQVGFMPLRLTMRGQAMYGSLSSLLGTNSFCGQCVSKNSMNEVRKRFVKQPEHIRR